MQKLTISLTLFLLVNSLFSIQNKQELFDNIKNKFKNTDQIYFEFSTEDMSGEMYLKKGNQYKIILSNRKIVSDGQTIWNHSFTDKQVLISNFKELKSASIENLFFDILAKSVVIKVSSKRNSQGQKMTLLQIYNQAQDQEIEFMLDKNNTITSVDINSQIWYITNLKFSLPQSTTFDFSPDSSLELIDLR